LIAGLFTTDKSFLMHLWDILLPPAVITLNMLRTSRINPKLSAATHIYGQYDFNRVPMAPPGTRIIAHETPNRRKCGLHMDKMGGILDLHWSITDETVYVTKTRGERVVETVEFQPEKFTLPFPLAQDLATQAAAAELTHALLHPQPAGPFC
jgi:hypothetical protein